MDPNATLAEIRALVEGHFRHPLAEYEVDQLTTLVAALDAWITHGGALPRAWYRLTP